MEFIKSIIKITKSEMADLIFNNLDNTNGYYDHNTRISEASIDQETGDFFFTLGNEEKHSTVKKKTK